ncbi:hypothetical protein DAI22_09g068400 [Oryza sativa Japonica Group]|nr:hypothetical protein DAI22_09g068400 [Oryza sativa Japonica Group]
MAAASSVRHRRHADAAKLHGIDDNGRAPCGAEDGDGAPRGRAPCGADEGSQAPWGRRPCVEEDGA